MSARLAVSNLEAGYTPGVAALRDVDFALEAGSVAVVLGPNGGGKTTLFRALLGEMPWRRGTVDLPGACAYVPQVDRTRLDFPVSALDVASMGAYARTPWWRRLSRADRAAAREALARLGLGDAADARFGSLSGGQRQRVLLARALVQQAPVLLLDEPGSAVDAVSAVRMSEVCRELRADGRILLISSHDVAQAREWDAVLCLNGAQIAFGAPDRALEPGVLRATYGDELVLVDGGRRAVTLQHGHAHGHQHGSHG